MNNQTIRDVFPLPRVDDELDLLHNAKYFSSLNLQAGYRRSEVKYKVRYKDSLVYLDDEIVFGDKPEERSQHFEWMPSRFIDDGLKLNFDSFFKLQVDYLGYTSSSKRIVLTSQEPITKPARNVHKSVKTNVQNAQINDSSNESNHNSDDDIEESDDEKIMQIFTQRQLNASADAAQQAVTTAQALPTVYVDPRADLPRAVAIGRPQRERRPPQRYAPVSCIRIITNRAKKR